MPHITTAMHRSLRRGVGDIMLNSLVGKRTITGEADNVKNTFSSWDNCMAKTYCKFVSLFALNALPNNILRWPVIAVIVVVSLIVLSIITCIARCCCCGYSCCCSCFSFLKCCDCCGDSCEGKRNKPMKHLDGPSPFGQPAYHQGYQAPAPMMGGALPVAAKTSAPQYAQFEVGKNGLYVDPTPTPLSEDALPPMPSWDGAAKKQVLTEDEKNGVELGELNPTTGQHIPLMTGGGVSPNVDNRGPSPFGARPGPGVGGTGYIGVAEDHYDQNQAAYNTNGRGYGASPVLGAGLGSGMGPRRMGTPQMRGSPGPGQGMRRPGFGPDSPQQSYNSQGRGYEGTSPQESYGQHDGFDIAPVAGGYGRPPPQRQFSNDQYGSEQYNSRPYGQPSRQYSSDSQHPLAPTRQYSDGPGYPQDDSHSPRINRVASPLIQNHSGFDFNGQQHEYQSRPTPPPQQYSRPSPPPQQMSYESSNRPHQGGRGTEGYFPNNSTMPTYDNRTPPPTEAPAYPGYKPYQSGQAGRGREPQGWDPVQ